MSTSARTPNQIVTASYSSFAHRRLTKNATKVEKSYFVVAKMKRTKRHEGVYKQQGGDNMEALTTLGRNIPINYLI